MSAVSQTLRDGLAAAQAKQFDRARTLLQRVTVETPDDPIAWFWLAIVSPSADDAIPCLRRVLALDPAHEQAREALTKLLVTNARALAGAGRKAEARAQAAEACEINPGVASLWLALVAISDDQVERIDALRRVSALTPEDPQVRTRLRQALLARGVMVAATDRAEARHRFREAVALDPTDIRVRQALANLADTRAEWLDALRELLAVAPDHASARAELRNALVADAETLAAAGQIDEACARFREAIDRVGPDVGTLIGLAAIAADAAEAERATEQAFALDPSDGRAIAAMDRLRAARIDPATLEAPMDAFARFESAPAADVSGDDPLGELDGFDAFATLSSPPEVRTTAPPSQTAAAEPPAKVAPVVEAAAAPEPPAAVETAPAAGVGDAVETAEIALDLSDAFGAAEPAVLELTPPPSAFDAGSAPDLRGLDELIAPPVSAVVPDVAEVEVQLGPSDVAAPALEAGGGPAAATETAAPLAEAAAAAGAEAAADSSGAPPTWHHTVMVVDDSPTIRKILGLTLERAGYRVLAEADGEAAITRLHDIVPDLILLDIAMPKLDGYEVCKRIKKNARTAKVPVVMLSGKDAFFDKVKGHMAGASEYLTKPFEAPAVLAVVTSYCRKAGEVMHG